MSPLPSTVMNRRARRIRLGIVGAVMVALALVGVGVGVVAVLRSRGQPGSTKCQVVIGSAKYTLDAEQAANALTITAVAAELGMAHHAVTVGLAAAFGESGLRNLDHGDRDSLGMFQQRPSQGWGTPSQIMQPRYAARAFLSRLAQVEGWETLPVTVAAQRVQRSAAPDAYAHWEGEARTLARALTGEVAGAWHCNAPIRPA